MSGNRKVLILTTDENFSDFQIDVGDIPVGIAVTLLNSAAQYLESILPFPILKSYGKVIIDPYEDFEEEDEEDT